MEGNMAANNERSSKEKDRNLQPHKVSFTRVHFLMRFSHEGVRFLDDPLGHAFENVTAFCVANNLIVPIDYTLLYCSAYRPYLQSCSAYRPYLQSFSDYRPYLQSCSAYRPYLQFCSAYRPYLQSCSAYRPYLQSCSAYRPYLQSCSAYSPYLQSCSAYRL